MWMHIQEDIIFRLHIPQDTLQVQMYKKHPFRHIIYISKGSVFLKKFIYRMFSKREKGYYFLLFFIFVTMTVSQILMRKDGMMGYFSAIETFEGEFISDEEMFNREEI